MPKLQSIKLTESERSQIAEILDRRANEIAGFSGEYRAGPGCFSSVELALSREINRLRQFANKIRPTKEEINAKIATNQAG